MKSLKDLRLGESGIIEKLLVSADMRKRFLDIGLIDKTRVSCVGISPAGDPKAFLIRGAVIAIRLCDCEKIMLENSKE